MIGRIKAAAARRKAARLERAQSAHDAAQERLLTVAQNRTVSASIRSEIEHAARRAETELSDAKFANQPTSDIKNSSKQ